MEKFVSLDVSHLHLENLAGLGGFQTCPCTAIGGKGKACLAPTAAIIRM
jgi:hypothetical protein